MRPCLGTVGPPEQSTRERSGDILARLFVYVNLVGFIVNNTV